MWRQIQRSTVCLALGVGCYGVGLAQAAEPSAAPQRVQELQRTDLPKAKAALKSHQRHCDTQLAVMHARRAMAMAEEGGEASTWVDMEVLTAQCQVTAQKLRDAVQKLEAELDHLQAVQPAPTSKP